MLVVAIANFPDTSAKYNELRSKGTGNSHCIKSVEELISAFKRRETITGNHTTLLEDYAPIFDMELEYLLTYTMMFLTYQVSFPGNTTDYQCPVMASACCTPINRENRITVMMFQSQIFRLCPAPFLIMGSPLCVLLQDQFRHITFGVREYCWSPPAFCPGLHSHHVRGILRTFSIAVSWKLGAASRDHKHTV